MGWGRGGVTEGGGRVLPGSMRGGNMEILLASDIIGISDLLVLFKSQKEYCGELPMTIGVALFLWFRRGGAYFFKCCEGQFDDFLIPPPIL